MKLSALKHRFLYYIIVSLSLFTTIKVDAQDSTAVRKLSPTLLRQPGRLNTNEKQVFRVAIYGNHFPEAIDSNRFNARKVGQFGQLSFYNITTNIKELKTEILPFTTIVFAEYGRRKPHEEAILGDLDLGTNKINTVHRQFPQWNGENTTVSIQENLFDTSDIDIAGRYLRTSLSPATYSTHATNMATMIAGAGNSWYLGRGAAPGSLVSSSDFANLLPDADSAYRQYHISVQNHSYGVGIENFYGADAAAFDISSINNPALLHVFSSGNVGLSADTAGTYAGLPGFANLTGSFKMAKNIITVGATDSFGVVAPLSSKGPAYDGRIKPDLVAFGIDGSSGAAALVSGVALILQQAYKDTNGSLPANELVKAILVNSADDVGNKEVDYATGFGALNALNAARTLRDHRYINDSIAKDEVKTYSLSIPPHIQKVKLTLAWNDQPAFPNAAKALINDLDLELVNTSSGALWKPWVLNPSPNLDSLQQTARRGRDSLNNIEQITIDDPSPGNYIIRVKGYQVTTLQQAFYIAYQLDTANVFEWQFPVATDYLFPSSLNTLRWKSSYPETSGNLEYSIDSGTSWQRIDSISLTTGYYNWHTPSITGIILFRMNIGNSYFISDTLTIADRTPIDVGFNCADSFLYHWNKLPAIDTYRVYHLGSRYLEPMFITTDSFTVLQKNTNPSLYYAVAPVIAGREGVKSYTLNYTTQGVECYIRSFLATLYNNTAQLQLELGSLYNINKIVLEKLSATGFKQIQQVSSISELANFTDSTLLQGINTYRIKLELAGGGTIYSETESVNYFNSSDFIVFPNPVSQSQTVKILVKDPNMALLQIFSISGVKVFEKIIDDVQVTIPVGFLSKGLYILQLTNNSNKTTSKLIVY